MSVYTRADLPQPWASTQMNLGTALRAQGERTGGETGTRLLGEAVEAYRAALEVYTRADLPQPWAGTQMNLGNALSAQGERTGGETGARLLGEAVAAYRAALAVFTRQDAAPYWGGVQFGLAQALANLEQWEESLSAALAAREVYPDDREAYTLAVYVCQERLFRFEQAFEWSEGWLKRYPDDIEQRAEHTERLFVVGRFSQAADQAAALQSVRLEERLKMVLQAIRIGALVGMGERDQAQAQFGELKAAIARQPESFVLGRTFSVTRHFVSQHPAFAGNRDGLMRMYEMLENADRHTIISRLESLDLYAVAR